MEVFGSSMIDRTLEFPSDFVWGSATAAHQVEGDNRHNDWWAHELAPDTNAIEPSGIAAITTTASPTTSG